jgi:hypothetical protein
MADRERVKADIAAMATRPNAVRLEEIERIVNQLQLLGFKTVRKDGLHSTLFRVGAERFTLCAHNAGRKELKPVYVRAFLSAMAELGLYGE